MSRNDTQKSPPDTRLVLKPKKGEGSITLASFWTDGERPSGGLDRRITRLKVEWKDKDGNLHTEVVDNTSRDTATHYCNLYRGEAPSRGQQRTAPRNEPPPDTFNDDDCPF